MKRILTIMLLAVALLGFTGQAQAYFGTFDLIRVVYDTTYNGSIPLMGSNETGTTLGDVNSLVAASNFNVGGGANAFTNFTGTNFANLRVGYYAIGATGAWMSGSDAITSNSRRWAGYQTNANSVNSRFALAPTDDLTIQLAQSGNAGYWGSFNAMSPSSYGTFLNSNRGEISLANLATVGYVDMGLYSFATPNSAVAGVRVATIRTYADGHTTINPSAVPVPPAIMLLAPGLLGLIALRKKIA